MRKTISVFGLYTRSSIFKFISVALLTFGVEAVTFFLRMKEEVKGYEADTGFSPLELIIDRSNTDVFFIAGLTVLSICLIFPGCNFGSVTGYTIQRLSIGEKQIFFIHSASNLLFFISFWFMQIITVYVMAFLYSNNAPGEVFTEIGVFTAFFKNDFLHNVFPLYETVIWIRNIFAAAALSMCAALFPFLQRRGKKSIVLIAFLIYITVFFMKEMGELGGFIIDIIIAAVLICEALYQVLSWEKGDENIESNLATQP